MNPSIQQQPKPSVATPGSFSLKPQASVNVQRRQKSILFRMLEALASLKLTVVLFALSICLVLLGTVAQVFASNFAVTQQYFRSLWVWVPWQLIVHFGKVFFWVSPETTVDGAFPFPGGWAIGSALLVNLLAAHATRFKLTWKRSGVLVLHAGLILLMVGELITGLYAVEGQMTIEQGSTSNYLESATAVELAFTTPIDAKNEDVVTVSGKALRNRKEIDDPELPAKIDVVRFLPNAGLGDPKADEPNPATEGIGLRAAPIERQEGAGVDADSKVDTPAAFVTFTDKATGQALGTYLVHLLLNPQKITAGGKDYEVVLRRQRTYKPYSIHLIRFDHKLYPGTSTPRDFRSTVQLTDSSRNESRKAEIYMNHPLFYQGETFYQQSFLIGDRGTVLQVVRNPGWVMPYLSCLLVTLGMALHFIIHLVGFLNRRMA